MVIPYEVFESNKRLKKNIENAEDEIDKMLYRAAKSYINSVVARSEQVSERVMRRVEEKIKNNK